MDWKVDFHGFCKIPIPITCSLLYREGMMKGMTIKITDTWPSLESTGNEGLTQDNK